MADSKNNKFKKKPFPAGDKANKGKRVDKPKPDKKAEAKVEKKPENRNDFKCKNCGGQLVRRWVFPDGTDGKSYTKLVCEDCGAYTKPRDIKYGENGFVWGCRAPKENTEQKKAG